MQKFTNNSHTIELDIPKADVDCLYMPRSSVDRGMIQLELSYKISLMKLYKYLAAIQHWMLQLIMKHEKSKKKIFYIKRSS